MSSQKTPASSLRNAVLEPAITTPFTPPHRKRRFSLAKFKEKLLQLSSLQVAKERIKQHFWNLNQLTFRQYLGNNEILVRVREETTMGMRVGFPLILLGCDTSITPSILLNGIWESHLTPLLAEKVKPGMTVLDIGANMGYYSALFASKGAYVHAFEPNPVLQGVLRKNIYMNSGVSQTPKCIVNQCAVGKQKTLVTMRFPSWLTGGASMKKDIEYQKKFLDPHYESVKVNQISLDEYVEQNKLEEIDIIKIDIEGYEEEALRGATKLLTRSQNLMLCMEYSRDCYSDSFPSWLFSLFPRGYLPKYRQSIDVQFLEAYQKGEVFSSIEIDLLDIVFTKGRRFP